MKGRITTATLFVEGEPYLYGFLLNGSDNFTRCAEDAIVVVQEVSDKSLKIIVDHRISEMYELIEVAEESMVGIV